MNTTYVAEILLAVVAMQSAAIVALQIGRARRTRAERELCASRERFRLIANCTPAMIWTARSDTTLDYLNDACADFTGLPIEKLRDEGWLEAVHPDDRERCIGIYAPAMEARRPFLMEYRMRRADGAYRWLLATGVPKYEADGSLSGYFGCDVDIHERREAEDRVRASQAALEASYRKIQHLASRLIESQDTERARLARDLHDDVSQQLAGLAIALSDLRRRWEAAHAGEDVQRSLRALHERTTTLAQNVRHLSHDLHPTVLRHAGLLAALTSYCAEIERVHGVVVQCSTDGDCACIPSDVSLCLYRIAQEALRNVIAHASASRTDVRLLCTDHVELTVVDDGNGFDVADSLKRSKGLGLVSINERARLVRGSVSITSEPKKGTRVHVRAPLLGSKPDPGREPQDVPEEYTLP